MDQKRLDDIVNALTEKGVNRPCSRCGNPRFSVVGETLISLQDDPSVFSIGGPSVPAVVVACDKCGYITQHAIAPLGLMRSAKA
jgi:hypothetical protein